MEKLAVDGGTPVRTKPFPEWPIFGDLERELMLEAVNSGEWGGIARIKLEQFERRFAAYHDAEYAIAVNNGTVAITVALKAAGVGPGDEVIIPPYTFIATATAPLMFGAIPVFADIDPETLLIDPAKVEEAITPRTKAIIAVHIAGASCDMTRLKEIAKKHGLALIEDCAQAVGTQWEGKGVGAIGDLGTFSFQSSKNLNSGEGGLVISNHKEMADKAWSMANVGRIRDGGWYQHESIGWNFRMTEFQAAILLAQMTRLEEQCIRRERNAELLTRLLSFVEGIRTMKNDPRMTRHSYHLYLFCLDAGAAGRMEKNDFVRKLKAEGIPSSTGYVSLNKNKAILSEIKSLTGEDRFDRCPVSERVCDKEAFWLTQNLLLGDEEDMYDIARAIKKVVQS